VLNHEARVMAHIPTSLSVSDLFIVLTAVAAVCLIAGVLATRKLRTADPADVF
jgi:ABC-type lipoprotein release transport system permease subunit